MRLAANCKKAVCLLFVLCFVILTACSPVEKLKSFFASDGSGYIFKCSLSSDPETLDPQLAYDQDSVAVTKNTFVGLLKANSDGSIVNGVANGYDISEDGLIYTFYLDEGWQWKAAGGFTADLTARDFSFGFRRLFDPRTASPYAKNYYCIKNSMAVNTGVLDLDELGVTALDDYTLEIALDYPNPEFPRLLTQLPASPCNQEFFEGCKGKYGLEAECIASNGPFYVRYWLHDKYGKDNYVRLRKNDGYAKSGEVCPAGVNFLIEADEETRKSDFLAGTTDCCLLRTYIEPGDGFSCRMLYTSSIGLIINPVNTVLSRQDVKEILSLAIDINEISKEAPGYLLPAEGLVAQEAFSGDIRYRDKAVVKRPESNPKLAEYKWSFLLTENEKLSISGKNILIPESFADSEYLSLVTQTWSDNLKYNVGLEVVNDGEYQSRLSSGRYDICLAVIGRGAGKAINYLLPFCDGSLGFVCDYCEDAVIACERGETPEGNIKICLEAEKKLLAEYAYIPLWYAPQFLFAGEDSCDFEYDFFTGAVIFEKAKHY